MTISRHHSGKGSTGRGAANALNRRLHAAELVTINSRLIFENAERHYQCEHNDAEENRIGAGFPVSNLKNCSCRHRAGMHEVFFHLSPR